MDMCEGEPYTCWDFDDIWP